MRCSTGLIALILLLAPGVSFSQGLESPGCVYDRRVYPEGSTICRNGNQMQCEDGFWGNIGDCEDDEAPAPPIANEGDYEPPLDD